MITHSYDIPGRLNPENVSQVSQVSEVISRVSKAVSRVSGSVYMKELKRRPFLKSLVDID